MDVSGYVQSLRKFGCRLSSLVNVAFILKTFDRKCYACLFVSCVACQVSILVILLRFPARFIKLICFKRVVMTTEEDGNPRFYICDCFTTDNIFLEDYKLHVRFVSEQQFTLDYRAVSGYKLHFKTKLVFEATCPAC